jgi:phosphogluconate dehydratase
MHGDVTTIMGEGLAPYAKELKLENGILAWSPTPAENRDDSILRSVNNPFSPEGGLRLLAGNLGRAIIKVSAVAPKNRIVEAPAVVFHNQDSFAQAFKEGALQKDFVAVLRFQGPQANGMPELHKLTPYLGALQDQGFQVALVTDGRMSGASGKVPAAIHLIPEAINGGAIAIIRDGDIVRLDAEAGRLEILVPAAEWRSRKPVQADLSTHQSGLGRELFGFMRNAVSDAEHGATVFGLTE